MSVSLPALHFAGSVLRDAVAALAVRWKHFTCDALCCISVAQRQQCHLREREEDNLVIGAQVVLGSLNSGVLG